MKKFPLNRRALLAGASGLLAAGCAGLVGPPPPSRLYLLKPALPRALPGAKVAWSLSIQLPDASAGLDSDRVVIRRPPVGMDFYADSAWPDRLPVLVQGALLEAFEAGGRIDAVARDSDAVRADYYLATDLRDFEARYDEADGVPAAVVRIGARMIAARTRDIAGYTESSREVRAARNSVEAAVEALVAAFSGVLDEIVPWALGMPPLR
jgi:cholesterol transport system auxiliary component